MILTAITGEHVTIDDDVDVSVLGGIWITGAGYAYAYNKVTKKAVAIHKYVTNTGSGQMMDHINGEKMDCRRSNLRPADATQNARNRKVRGFHIDRKGGHIYYRVRVMINGKRFNVGKFPTPEAAQSAYVRVHSDTGSAFQPRLKIIDASNMVISTNPARVIR